MIYPKMYHESVDLMVVSLSCVIMYFGSGDLMAVALSSIIMLMRMNFYMGI